MDVNVTEILREATVVTAGAPAVPKRLATIVPAFNERERICDTIKALRAIEPRLVNTKSLSAFTSSMMVLRMVQDALPKLPVPTV
jgi:hypothetical protein